MSIVTSNNSRSIRYQVTEQPGGEENLKYTYESRPAEKQSKKRQDQSSPSTFWDELAMCCCCCLYLKCAHDGESAGCDDCCNCDSDC